MRLMALALICIFAFAAAANAEQTLQTFSWDELKAAGKLPANIEVVPKGDKNPFAAIKVVSTSSQPKSVTILVVENPGITESTYAIVGQVRYENDKGKGYLEMWNLFPDGGQYFSRTLAAYGPMKYIQGTSGWRKFVLPFFLQDSPARPNKLIINVVLPARGTVYVGPLKLVQYKKGENPLAIQGAWWDESTGGAIGGIFGGLVGGLGGLIGFLAARGKARGFVMAALNVILFASLASLLVGLFALFRGQPFGVYYALILVGVIGTLVPAFTINKVRKRYEELEFRKMQAADGI